jgi:hypothetical protein
MYELSGLLHPRSQGKYNSLIPAIYHPEKASRQGMTVLAFASWVV